MYGCMNVWMYECVDVAAVGLVRVATPSCHECFRYCYRPVMNLTVKRRRDLNNNQMIKKKREEKRKLKKKKRR